MRREGASEGERKTRGSKLDPYKTKVDYLLSQGVWNTLVILRKIQADGNPGGN
ncbi:MAG: hypothetical protein JXA13_13775 [Anaerolineales bacterium]|nr:hypothetical protein [Anaerolineales bacterium]